MSQAPDLDRIFEDAEGITTALHEAFWDTVRRYRREGGTMFFWVNGQVREIPADQVPLPEDSKPAAAPSPD